MKNVDNRIYSPVYIFRMEIVLEGSKLFLNEKIDFENQKFSIFKWSLANFGDRYQKAIWLGFISDQKSTLDLMPDIQVQKWIPFSTWSSTPEDH